MAFTGSLQKVSGKELAKLAEAVNAARDALNEAGQNNIEGQAYAVLQAQYDGDLRRYHEAMGY